MATDARRAGGLVLARQAGAARAVWARWRASLLLAGAALLVTRLLMQAVGMAAVQIWGVSGRAGDFDPAGLTSGFGGFGDLLLAPMARWDSVWYLAIAHDGYGDPTRAAFYPLYPLVAQGILGAIVVSWLGAWIGLAALHRLGTRELGEPAARTAVWLMACSPMAFFLTAVYTEGLFLALSVGAFLAARNRCWAWAGLLGGLAAATRNAGLVLLVPLALLWWSQRPRRTRDAAWLALVPAGFAVFCGGLALSGHGLRASFEAQDAWSRHFRGPFLGAWDGAVAAFEGARQLLSGSRTPVYFAEAGGDPFVAAAHNLEMFLALVLAVPALVGVWRRLPLAYGAYALSALALVLSWPVAPQPLMSLSRYLLTIFPLFLWLGWWAHRSPMRVRVVTCVFLAVQAIAVAEFSTWHFVA